MKILYGLLLVSVFMAGCNRDTQVDEKTVGTTIGFAEEDFAQSAQQTRDGGYIITGYSNSIRGNYDIHVVKVNRQYTVEWSKEFGNNSPDQGNKVIQTQDGGYAVVGTVAITSGNKDIFVVKMDAKGKVLWSRHFGGGSADEGQSIIELPDASLVILGSTSSFGAGNFDVYLIKTDAFGRPRWVQTYGGFDADRGFDLAATNDGGIIVTGSTANFGATKQDAFLLKVDEAGAQQWFVIYDDFTSFARNEGRAVAVTPDSGYVLVGLTNSGAPFPLYDIFVVKTDLNGNRLWSSNYDFSSSDEAYAVQISNDRNILISGKTYLNHALNDYEMVLLKINLNGGLLWTRTYGGPKDEIAYSLQPTSNGYLMAGYTQSYGAGKSDMYLIEVDENGDPL